MMPDIGIHASSYALLRTKSRITVLRYVAFSFRVHDISHERLYCLRTFNVDVFFMYHL